MVIQARDDDGGGDSEKRMDSRYILKVKTTGFTDTLNRRYERKED